jgi:hypothetical protein
MVNRNATVQPVRYLPVSIPNTTTRPVAIPIRLRTTWSVRNAGVGIPEVTFSPRL